MRYLFLTLLTAATGMGGEPPIRFPSAPPVPPPVVTPDTPAKLLPENLYVVDSDIELVVLSSPAGVLKAVGEPGPLRIKGKFSDGSGGYETRTYKGKFVYTVEAVKDKGGLAELIVIPVGLKTESEVIRRLIEAELAPMPPPCPDPKPDPKPDPEPQPPVVSQEVAIVVIEETSARTPAISRVLADTKYWTGLTARGNRFRFYDKDAPDAAKYIPHVPNVPGVLVMTKDGKKLASEKLPATTTELDALLKKLGAK